MWTKTSVISDCLAKQIGPEFHPSHLPVTHPWSSHVTCLAYDDSDNVYMGLGGVPNSGAYLGPDS